MPINIIEERSGNLEEYALVPISFEVRSRYLFTPEKERAGYAVMEEQVAPYIKDYDQLERPTELTGKFDLSNWAFFAARNGRDRVGGALIAYKTPGLEMLRGEKDAACLWDIRVRPEMRGSGVGTALFDSAVDWCKKNRVRRLRVETQDINVPACRFYQRMGCRLEEVNPAAYPAEMNEIQLIWVLEL